MLLMTRKCIKLLIKTQAKEVSGYSLWMPYGNQSTFRTDVCFCDEYKEIKQVLLQNSLL